MSMRTKKPVGALEDPAQVVDALARSTSSPSWVSFSEMLRSMPDSMIASIDSQVLARRGCRPRPGW